MKTKLVILFVIVSVVVAPYPGSIPEKCKKKYEVFTRCGSCEPTCDKPKPTWCPKHCVVGCQCIKGYYRNKKGDCVKWNECPKEQEKCKKKNEVFMKCGTACEPSCDKPYPTFCTKNCVIGCQCIKGYYRNKQGECVKLNECKKASCSDISCAPGYFCKLINGKPSCIKEQNKCKKKNEIFTKCGTACEPSCDKPNPGVCTLQCIVGCQCIKGYYRNKYGDCVKLNECPKKDCSSISCRPGTMCKIIKGKPGCVPVEHNKCKKKNEMFVKCKSSCEPSCDKLYPAGCSYKHCKPGCECKKGYYRNKYGDCVKQHECPKEDCSKIRCQKGYTCKVIKGKPQCIQIEYNKCKRKNEVYTKCGTACEPSCDKPYPGFCPLHCVPKCQCIKGYYRNKQGDCVKLNQCSKKASCSDISCAPGYTCKMINWKPQCVKIEHNKCKKKYEVFTKCGSACEPSCDKPYLTCYKKCVIGCQCQKGYYRNNYGECVKWNECKKAVCAKSCRKGYMCKIIKGRPECIPIKYYKSPATGISCANVRCSTPGGCAMVIPQGCVYGNCVAQPKCVDKNPCTWMNCSPGKKCVLRQVVCVRAPCDPVPECVNVAPYGHPTCPVNEHMVPCKSPCSDMKCGQKEPMICPAICTGPGCACKTGYYRNNSGKCVTKKECGK